MAIAGLRGTGDWGTDERPKNFREMILWRDPNGQAPMTALMSKMRTESTTDAEFAWWEEELNPVRLRVNGAVTTTTVTAITVFSNPTDGFGNGLDLVAGDLLMVEATPSDGSAFTYEMLEVASVTSATAITVVRGAAGTTAATIPTNSFLLKVGSIFEEGTTSPDASTRNPKKYSNYTEIFKTTYRITNTAKATKLRTGDPVKTDKKRKMFDHAVALEHAALFGVANEDTSGTEIKRATGGMFHFLNQAVAGAAASGNDPAVPARTRVVKVRTVAPTTDQVLDDTYQMFDYNAEGAGNERLVFAGNGFLNKLNKIVRADAATRINYDGTVDVFGMRLQRWILPQGTWYVRSHPLMNVNTLFTNGAFFINPAGVRYRPVIGRDTDFQDNIQANDADETKGQWLTEAGFEFHHLNTMMYYGLHY